MPVVSVVIKAFAAFSDCKVIIISTGCPDIEEISPSLSSPDAFAINAFHSFVVVFVRHNSIFWFVFDNHISRTKIKLFLNCQNLRINTSVILNRETKLQKNLWQLRFHLPAPA